MKKYFKEMLESLTNDGKMRLVKNNICNEIVFANLTQIDLENLGLCRLDEEIVNSIVIKLRIEEYKFDLKNLKNKYSIRTMKLFKKFGWSISDLFLFQNMTTVITKLLKYKCPMEDVKMITINMIIARFAHKLFVENL